ncbi:MAG TPA: phosphoribosylglycinamide formyltransferase [Gemmatimonadaceae bacterium]|nr:phosphoribosylglycinamide formyltransferase [Gemmatimonadaceae bacterium]
MLKRIGVLASGGGSNLAALYDHLRQLADGAATRGEAPEIVLVASDQERAGALERARKWGVACAVLADRGADAGQMEELLREHRVDLIVLAGYLRLVPRSVVRAYRGRIINIHPALLPAFGGAGMYGQRVHSAVIEQGARVSGATVHFVDEEYDRGPIIAQWPVPVLPDDTPAALAARVLRVEHLLLPRAVCAVAKGSVRLDEQGRLARPGDAAIHDGLAFTLRPESDETIVEGIERVLPDS